MTKNIDTTQTTTTDFSMADRYIEDRAFGRWERIKVKFPRTYDRKEANYDFASELNHRSYGGKVPFDYYQPNDIQKRPPLKHNASKYLYINPAKNGSNVPKGYYGTSSGIFEIDFIPFSAEDPTTGPYPSDNPTTVSDDLIISGGNEFFIARSISAGDLDGVTAYYYPASGVVFLYNKNGEVIQTTGSYNHDVGRFEWWISPDFQAAVEPDVRFPNGARKRNYFNNY